jgi:hypothetical protein
MSFAKPSAFVFAIGCSVQQDRTHVSKRNWTPVLCVCIDDAVISSQEHTANGIASFFSCHSCALSFRVLKVYAETLPLIFSSRSDVHELGRAFLCVRTLTKHAFGSDGVHNETLSNFPLAGREFLLSMYGRICYTQKSVPDAWS